MRVLLSLFVVLHALHAHAAPPRSAAERAAFVRANPCPATNLRRGACPGYQVDHTIPLCLGGLDARSNMVWLTVEEHRFKTFIDLRECRKYRKMAATPAREALQK